MALPAPRAAAQGLPEYRWRLASSFPPSLDTIYGGAEVFAASLDAITQGRFKVEVYPPGELMPAMGVLDGVANGEIEIAHTGSYYFTDRDPAFGFGTAMPFGLNSRLQNAWLHAGGGNELMNEFYRSYGFVGLPCGNTGTQMGGWFTRPVASLADVRGLKMRVPGLAQPLIRRMGGEPVQTPGGEIFEGLQSGRIDAAEWVGPYDDEKLGFYRVARYYYYPGWWEPSTTLHLFVNEAAWAGLPDAYQEAVRVAASHANAFMQAKYDVQNPAALKRLVTNGVELRAFPEDVLRAAYSASQALYAEFSEASPAFRRIFEHWQAFRGDGYLWWLVNEIAMDAFMVRARAAGAP
ncbi:MAG: TRAP transporter substrate-binding protein [Pseudomonadota bacterium]